MASLNTLNKLRTLQIDKNRRVNQVLVNLLLNDFPATGAYSLRKINASYSGSAIRVRRSSDNSEQNIGFSGNNLDETNLLSFVGGGNGFVTAWYDQSGNGRNATQTTASAQPQIVNSGSTILASGKPALKFDEVDDQLLVTPYSFQWLFSLQTRVDAMTDFGGFIRDSGDRILISSTNSINRYCIRREADGALVVDDPTRSAVINVPFLYSLKYLSGDVEFFVNGLSGGSSGFTNILNLASIGGGRNTDASSPFTLNEIVFYGSDESANRGAIEANINSYYGVY